MTDETKSEAYPLPTAVDQAEVDRLHRQFLGIKEFLGGALSLAPLEAINPKSILEIGSGGGSWAAQAAETFPDAEVLAVDLAPLPPHLYKENLKFKALDLTHPLPFEPGSFDIVHARFVLPHLPNFEKVLKRAIELLRPGGWLLLEDGIPFNPDSDKVRRFPATVAFWKEFSTVMKSRGVNALSVESYESILRSSGVFSEINVRKVPCAFTNPADTPEGRLGATMAQSFFTGPMLHLPCVAPETRRNFQAEMKDPSWECILDMRFLFCRKKE